MGKKMKHGYVSLFCKLLFIAVCLCTYIHIDDYAGLQIHIYVCVHKYGASQVTLLVKNPPANAGDMRYVGSSPELRRCPGGGHDNALQYSCLENSHEQRSLSGYSP